MAPHVACLIAMSVWLVAAFGCWLDLCGRPPSFHGAAGCKLKAMLRNNPASGQAAAKAMRTRVAVSVIRPANSEQAHSQGRATADMDAGQQRSDLHVLHVARLAHQVFAREIIPAGAQHPPLDPTAASCFSTSPCSRGRPSGPTSPMVWSVRACLARNAMFGCRR